jgi:hypothetical protein
MFNETIKATLTADNSKLLSSVSASRQAVESFRDKVMGLGTTIAGAFAGQRVISAFTALASRINHLDDVSQRLELPIEDIQILGQVASFGGVEVDTMAKAMTKLRLAGVQAAAGSEELRKSFGTLGIDAGRFAELGTVDQLKELARGFNGAGDQGTAFASIMGILGKNGAAIIPVLRSGSAAIDDVSRKLRVLGSEDVAAVARMSDELELLGQNIKNDLTRAMVDVAPLIQRMTKLLADAGEGLAIFTNPAGDTGRQGGELGGVAILRQIDLLEERKRKIDALSSGGDKRVTGSTLGIGGIAGQFRLPLSSFTAKADSELAALQARYKGLSAEDRAFAEQSMAFTRMQKSGMGDDAMRQAMQPWIERTAAIKASLKAERELAVESGDNVAKMEAQAAAAKKVADEVAGLKDRLAARLVSGGDAETRKGYAQAKLAEVLKGAGVGSTDELRRKAGGDSTGDSLRALEKALDLTEMIKQANSDLGQAAAGQWKAWQDAVKASTDEMERNRAEIDRINATIAAAAATANQQAAAKEGLAVEMLALRLTRDGQKAKADALVAEIALRREAANLATETGLSEERALKVLRDKASLQRGIAAGGVTGLSTRHGLGYGGSLLAGREGFLTGSASLRNSELERRARRRETMGSLNRAGADTAAKYWENQLDLQRKIAGSLAKLGLA